MGGMLLTFEMLSPRTLIHETDCPGVFFNCKKKAPPSAKKPLLEVLTPKKKVQGNTPSTVIE